MHNTLQKAGNTRSQQLSFVPSLSILWSTIIGEMNNDYYKAISTVYTRMNWNSDGALFLLPGFESYTIDDVQAVMNAYGNLAADGKIPEYEDPDPRGLNKGKKAFIWQMVTAASGRNEMFVRTVLYELYWATRDGSITRTEFLRPSSYKAGSQYREIPEVGEGVFGRFAKYLPFIVLGGGGLAAFLIARKVT